MSGGIYRGDGVFELDLSQDSKLPEVEPVTVVEPVAAEAVVESNPVANEVIE